MRPNPSVVACVLVSAGLLAVTAPAIAQGPTTKPAAEAELTVYPQFAAGDFFARNWMKTYPRPLTFSAEKPAAVTKEPGYQGPAVYTVFHLGDADDQKGTVLAIDDAANRAYVDANQNGDLTDDPRVNWDMKLTAAPPATGPSTQPERKEQALSIALPANWTSGPGRYGVKFFRVAGNERGFYTPIGAPTGSIDLGGKSYVLFLYDQLGKGRYDAKPGKKEIGTVVYIDTDGDGTWRPIGSSEAAGIGQPVQLGEKWYVFDASADGRHVTAYETAAPPPREVRPAITRGAVAPDFTIVMPDGSETKLSTRKGKVVLLDFWATWCGPCLKAMPQVQALHESVKNNPKAEIIGLCVMDEKSKFDDWIAKNRQTYTFTIGRDVAGKEDEGTLAAQAYGLSAIPTTLVIDSEGKVVEMVSGFTPENEKKVVDAMRKLGVKMPE